MRIFVAGAGGAVGRRLVPLLVAAGHEVTGTTRSEARLTGIAGLGARAVVADILDIPIITKVVIEADPEVVIEQVTDLAVPSEAMLTPGHLARTRILRDVGTDNLVAAAVTVGVRRFIAQGVGWLYAQGPEPHREDDPLGTADPSALDTLGGALALEHRVLESDGFDGLVLRYGLLYGPGAWSLEPSVDPHVHVDAAAWAALLAVERGGPGAYNIVDDDRSVSNDRARRELGWSPHWRDPTG
jgi:nucleoside-diphosphate-sugar epimerase